MMTYQPQRFAAPDGTELVVLAATEYDKLRELADESADVIAATEALAQIEQGAGTMPGGVLSLILNEGLSPLAAWRRFRGLSQAALAERAGLSQVWIGRIEGGGGHGSPATRRRLAAALDAPAWALEPDGDERPEAPASSRKGAKYAPLREHLSNVGAEAVTMRFAELDAMVGGLPASASLHRAWWANHGGNSQAAGWLGAGYAAEPDMARRTVTFRKAR